MEENFPVLLLNPHPCKLKFFWHQYRKPNGRKHRTCRHLLWLDSTKLRLIRQHRKEGSKSFRWKAIVWFWTLLFCHMNNLRGTCLPHTFIFQKLRALLGQKIWFSTTTHTRHISLSNFVIITRVLEGKIMPSHMEITDWIEHCSFLFQFLVILHVFIVVIKKTWFWGFKNIKAGCHDPTICWLQFGDLFITFAFVACPFSEKLRMSLEPDLNLGLTVYSTVV